MKKIARILTSIITVATLTLVPVAVHAQTPDPIEVGELTTTDPSTLPTTGAETPATPDTGFAPQENIVVKSSMIFVGGSALGAGLGYAYLSARKKRFN